MTRPQIVNVDAAIRVYYGTGFMSCADIKDIFGNMGSARMAKLRKMVREQEALDGIPAAVTRCVHTKTAFKAWGIDIDELVENRKKLKKLNLV